MAMSNPQTPVRHLAAATNRGGVVRGRSARFVPGLLVLVLSAALGRGQATLWIAPGTGSFTDAGNWSNGQPDSATDASITNGTAGTPTDAQLNGTSAVLDLTLAANNTLDINLDSTLEVFGSSLANNGVINVTAGSATNTYLVLDANVTLTGSGILNLSYGDHNGNAYLEANGSYTLTNDGSTIQGDGIIGNGGLVLVNATGGSVDANVSGQSLTLNGAGGIANTGLLEATGGGVLQISSLVANSGGSITAASGTVNVSTTVTGGLLNTQGSGVLETNGTAALAGVTLSAGSTYTGPLGSTTALSGSITNQGNFQLNAGSANNTVLEIDADTDLQGGGTVTLNSGDTNGLVYLRENGTNLTLTNVDNLIQGYGDIGDGGLTVVNAAGGTIEANVSGRTLTLDGAGGITNAGLLAATQGGALQLSATVNNSGGNITAAGGTVNVTATLSGGTLTTSGGGTLQTSGTATLDGSTQGPITLSAGSTYTGSFSTTTNLQGTIANDGTIRLVAGSASNTVLAVAANTTLSGGGAVALNSGDNNGQAYIQEATAGLTLTNVDNLIQGYGVIGNGGLELVNEAAGTVDANISLQTLLLNGGGNVVNSGLLEATNQGTLQITNVIANAGANITADGGTVLINGGATIRGGTLNSLDGGTLGVGNGTAILDGSANALTLSAGSTWVAGQGSQTTLLGTIVNQGTIQLSAGGATNTVLNIGADTTLQGGGAVTLNSGDDNGRAYLRAGASVTLTDQDNTIEGYGDVGNGSLALTVGPAATVNANVASQTLVLDGAGGVANAGLLEATGGGTLRLSTVVSNTGTVSANGGTVTLLGGTVQGGTLSGAGLETASTGTLDGATNGALTLAPASTYTGPLGTTTNVLGSIINQGSLQFNAGSATNTSFNLAANTTLSGGGTVTLNSGDNNGQSYIRETAAGLTLTNADNTIQGYGIIGAGGLSVVNDAAGIIEASGAGQTLNLNASGTVTNAGIFEGNDAVLALANDPSNLAADTLTGGTWMATDGGTVSFASPANAIVTNDATLILDGAGAEIQTRTGAGGTYQTLEQTLVTNAGTLEVTGNRDFAAANALTNNGVIQLGGGTLTAPALTNGPGSSLAGYGTFAPTGGVTIANGAVVSPGSAVTAQQIATLTFGTPLTLGAGGVLSFGLKNAPAAVAGTDYDTLVVSGALTISATAGSPFSIALTSINPTTGNPGLANFNPAQAYTWTLVTAGSIAGFSPADFSFNTSAFQNSLNGGTFLVGESGNTLTLDFTPVPEPSTWALMLGGVGAAAWVFGRRLGLARRPEPQAR